jgi:hypothetical protein
VVLFHLLFGRPLWLTDQNDNLTADELRTLACEPNALALQRMLNKGLKAGERRDASTDQKAAAALLRKLLEPDAATRLAFFDEYDSLIQVVLDEPFFLCQGLDGASLADMNASLHRMQRSMDEMLGLHQPDLVAIAKRATVRIGILYRDTTGTGKLLSLGSGTLLHDGQVLTAAHLFLNTSDPKFPPSWSSHLMNTPDWNDVASPIIIMIGLYEADELPSRWRYWAELVTPLAVLQKMWPGTAMLHDLAVLRVRGHLEVTPATFTSFTSDVYTVTQKHAAVTAVATLALPQAIELADPDTLISGITMVTVFGWFAPKDETTLYVPQAQKVVTIRRGFIETQALLHSAGSGGGQLAANGRLIAVNSMSHAPAIPMPQKYVAHGRLASKLLPEHGLLPCDD